MKRRQSSLQAVLWISVYILIVAAPVFILLIGPTPPGREWWREFSVALGFAGLSMMGLQFVLTARFKWLKAPYGSDVVYFFHRQISLVTFGLILLHPILLFIFSPDTLALLNVLTAPTRARFAVLATAALFGLVGLSVYRQRLKIPYEAWRPIHGLLAIAAIGGATGHIILVGHYTSTPWKMAFWIGYGVFWIGILLWVRLVKPLIETLRPYRVISVKAERGSAYTLRISPVGHQGIRFHPGQFAWLSIRANPFADQEHPFSISSSSEDIVGLEFTIKELGDFTAGIKNLLPGETVYLDGPYGAFSSDRHPESPGFLFLAGGIGVTPIMSMLRTMADRGEKRPVTLFYANNTWESVAFREELESLQKRIRLEVIHVIVSPPEGWVGEKGFITTELLERRLPEDAPNREAYLCGPQIMMDLTEKALVKAGMPMAKIHTERFSLV